MSTETPKEELARKRAEMKSKRMNAVVTQSEKDGQWYVEFKAKNNETWYVSEGYPTDRIAIQSVLDFCERMGATATVHIKVFNKSGAITENFEINA